jgi:hypothetical protein
MLGGGFVLVGMRVERERMREGIEDRDETKEGIEGEVAR